MRYITMLPKLMIFDIEGNPAYEGDPEKKKQSEMTHKAFLLSRLLDNAFSSSSDGIVRLLRLREIFLGINGSTRFIAIEEDDWQTLCVATKNPNRAGVLGYNVLFAHNFQPYILSVLEAGTKNPKDKKALEK